MTMMFRMMEKSMMLMMMVKIIMMNTSHLKEGGVRKWIVGLEIRRMTKDDGNDGGMMCCLYCYWWSWWRQLTMMMAVMMGEGCLTLKGPGGGGWGVEWNPPLYVSRDNLMLLFFAHRAFVTFFFRVLRNFWRYFRKNWAYRSKVMQRYVIERRLKIWEFSGFVYKTYGKWLFVLKIHFGL